MRTLLVLMVVALLAAPAAAQPDPGEEPSAPSSHETTHEAPQEQTAARDANRLGREGLAAYERRAWAEALGLFRRADQTAHSSVFILYMARCQERLERFDRARALYQQILDEELPPDAAPPLLRARADAERELAALPSPAPEPSTPTSPPTPTTPLSPAPEPVEPPIPETSSGMGPVPAIIAFSVGGAGLMIGGIFGGLALAADAEATKSCRDDLCPTGEDAAARALRFAHVSTSGFIVAGVGAVLGTVLLLTLDDGTDVALSPQSLVLTTRF
ncbi:MAG: tetratricopeptide repeat protein [Polyangiaceae bacterium]